MVESRPLYELIHDVLLEHLLDKSFPPNLVFGEAVVARAFESSRIPAAAALQRLKSQGLLRSLEGRGLVAADADTANLVRMELVEAGLRLPTNVGKGLQLRNQREHIYPQVEHAISASLSFGRFLVNESAMADFFGVSRTVAHEVLTRLERSGIVVQEGNQRWYAGPFTIDDLRDHFELRWTLEPLSLGQSINALSPQIVETRRMHVEKALTQRLTPPRMEKLETELHILTVLARANRQVVNTIRRTHQFLIPTHSTFMGQPPVEELVRTLEEHLEVYNQILGGNRRGAMQALERHIKKSLEPNVERLKRLGPLPDSLRPPFLSPA